MKRHFGGKIYRKAVAALALTVAFSMFGVLPRPVQAAENLLVTGEELIVVIDPGHGGENKGTEEGYRPEKEMTLITGLALAEELRQFDDITVYLTRTEDVDLSLEERADFAKSVDADFLFSVHYNASLEHNLFGSEVWVSTVAPYNAYGYQFGRLWLEGMRDKNFFLRGVKTRTGSSGDDYYGIIRSSVALGLPAVIMEHCAVDVASDAERISDEDKLREMGRSDAHAIAKYFGLKSEALGIDYSAYASMLEETDEFVISPMTVEDTTAPDHLALSLSSVNYQAGKASLQVVAADTDGCLLYYSYSTDGGKTFSDLIPWPGSDAVVRGYDQTIYLDLTFTEPTDPEVIVRVYDQYDLTTDSEPFTFSETFLEEKKPNLPELADHVDDDALQGMGAGTDTGKEVTEGDAALPEGGEQADAAELVEEAEESMGAPETPESGAVSVLSALSQTDEGADILAKERAILLLLVWFFGGIFFLLLVLRILKALRRATSHKKGKNDRPVPAGGRTVYPTSGAGSKSMIPDDLEEFPWESKTTQKSPVKVSIYEADIYGAGLREKESDVPTRKADQATGRPVAGRTAGGAVGTGNDDFDWSKFDE